MTRRLIGLLFAMALIVSTLGYSAPETASGHAGDCQHTAITLYEGLNRTGDAKVFCGSHPDLNRVTHTQSGNCDSHLLGDNTWDDCASSWFVSQNDHGYCVQIFGNPSYIFPLLEGGFYRAGAWSNFDGSENNTATSIRWTATSICGANP